MPRQCVSPLPLREGSLQCGLTNIAIKDKVGLMAIFLHSLHKGCSHGRIIMFYHQAGAIDIKVVYGGCGKVAIGANLMLLSK